jgi:hypothetical protein
VTTASEIARAARAAALAATVAAMLAVGGCAPAAPVAASNVASAEPKRFDLSRCAALEPGLYRCWGSEEPLCDPDFARPDVRCLQVTRSGVPIE